MTEIAFDKYAVKGAYHWTEIHGALHRLNAYTMGRYQMVLDALGDLPASSRVLDVGCGDGALSGEIAQRLKARVDGIDTTPLSIELAQTEFSKRKLAGQFTVIDGYRYPFDDSVFAAVVCSDVIEHVQQPKDMLREMWRVLAPGGRLVVTTPVRYTEAPLDRMHVQEWFPEAFRAFCSETLDAPVVLKLSHPVALAELYASGHPLVGRMARLGINAFAKSGYNPFTRSRAFRACSAQTVIAKKP